MSTILIDFLESTSDKQWNAQYGKPDVFIFQHWSNFDRLRDQLLELEREKEGGIITLAMPLVTERTLVCLTLQTCESRDRIRKCEVVKERAKLRWIRESIQRVVVESDAKEWWNSAKRWMWLRRVPSFMRNRREESERRSVIQSMVIWYGWVKVSHILYTLRHYYTYIFEIFCLQYITPSPHRFYELLLKVFNWTKKKDIKIEREKNMNILIRVRKNGWIY